MKHNFDMILTFVVFPSSCVFLGIYVFCLLFTISIIIVTVIGILWYWNLSTFFLLN